MKNPNVSYRYNNFLASFSLRFPKTYLKETIDQNSLLFFIQKIIIFARLQQIVNSNNMILDYFIIRTPLPTF